MSVERFIALYRDSNVLVKQPAASTVHISDLFDQFDSLIDQLNQSQSFDVLKKTAAKIDHFLSKNFKSRTSTYRSLKSMKVDAFLIRHQFLEDQGV